MGKMRRKINEKMTPREFVEKIVQAKLNDEPWGMDHILDIGQLTEDQIKRLNEHWENKRKIHDERYEKDTEDNDFDLPF